MKRRRNGVNKNIFKKLISSITAIVLVFNALPLTEIGEKSGVIRNVVVAAAYSEEDDPNPDFQHDSNNALSINIEDLVAYSEAYQAYPKYHQFDNVSISTSGDVTDLLDGFKSLGCHDFPFAGSIAFQSNDNKSLIIDVPLFDEVLDTATVNAGNAFSISRIYANSTEEASKKYLPLVANIVRADTISGKAKASWNITAKTYMGDSELQRVDSFAGFIDSMEANSSISLSAGIDLTGSLNSTISIETNRDVGFLCGNMGEGATLTSSITTSASSGNIIPLITTSNGNAGGYIGRMESGATFTLTSVSGALFDSNTEIKTTASDAMNGGYSGGVVGKNNCGTVTLPSSAFAISAIMTGVDGAGGVFGYYNVSAPVSPATSNVFDASTLTIDCKVNGTGYVGGLFGVLENNYNFTINGGAVVGTNPSAITGSDISSTHDNGSVSAYGGIVGEYKTNAQTNTLKIENIVSNPTRSDETSATYYGGGIGFVEESNPAYAEFKGFKLNNAVGCTPGGAFGGLVGKGDKSFIVSNNVIISTSDAIKGGGIVGSIAYGVLAFKGFADFSNASVTAAAYTSGAVVGYRDDALVFAEDEWKLTRKSQNIDDIATWGEIITFDDTNMIIGDVMTVDYTAAHSVTIGSVTPTAVNTPATFAKVALSLKIDASQNAFITNSNSITSSTNITLTDDVDLSGTGLTGFTRDNIQKDKGNTDKCTYSGTFNGGSHTITLAIGEPNGRVYRHAYVGLFGVTSGAKIQDVTLDGTLDVSAADLTTYAGALTGYSKDGINISGVTVKTELTNAGGKWLSMGGFIGEDNNSTGATVNVDSSSYHICITDSTFNGSISGNASDFSAAGVIGKIYHNKDEVRTWLMSDVTVSGSIGNSSNKHAQAIGGLIGQIEAYSSDGSYNSRTLTLDGISISNLTVSGTVGHGSNDTSVLSHGGLLGYSWLNTDVVMTNNGVTISDSSVNMNNIKSSDYGDFAGLVYNATGHWKINKLDIQSITASAANAKSYGMIVNKGWYVGSGKDYYSDGTRSALYLELPSGYTYNIKSFTDSGLPSGIVYDELVAYSAYYTESENIRGPSDGDNREPSDIMENGQGIVSIHTGLTMDGSNATSSYQAKTSRGAKPNPYTRYYYNLDTVTNDTVSNLSTPQMKLMSWGVRQYACANLKKHFADPFSDNTIDNANYNMQGYSWYPVDVDSAITVNGNFRFYNKEFEGSEEANVAGSNPTTYDYFRTSLYDSTNSSITQHYMMQNGLFHDVNGSVSVGADGITLQGNIGAKDNTSGTGALICGIIAGSSDANAGVNTTNGDVILDGVYVHNILAYSDYAPLLINKADSYVELNIENVKVKEDASYKTNSAIPMINGVKKAATSLIGDVGNDSARSIKIEFKKIQLDGRTAAIDDTNGANTSLTSKYHTDLTIFTNATLLNKFSYNSGGSGVYDYAIGLDWNSDTPVHNVTYGKEVGYTSSDSSTQYPDQERWYSGQDHSSGYLTSPFNSSTTIGDASDAAALATLFKGSFLPYVAVGYNASEKTYQLKVNHEAASLTGCGTYNHPYSISNGNQLVMIQQILAGNPPSGAKLNYIGNRTDHWCDGTTQCVSYTWDGSNFLMDSNNSKIVSLGDMRKHLAESYYKLANSITIEEGSGFEGLGDLGTTSDAYAVFRGVIDGGNFEVINKTSYPLIASSYGSVVTNLSVTVDANISIEQVSNSAFTIAAGGCDNYGAVIGQIMGGDNIIDGVTVTYSDKASITLSGKYAQLVPVGGYVGVIERGCLIFRGMETERGKNTIQGLGGTNSSKVTDGTNTDLLSETNTKWLYVNPIIGRVLDGYAMTEASAYRPFETGNRTYNSGETINDSNGALTMKNGRKNYSIPDVVIPTGDADKLDVDEYVAVAKTDGMSTDNMYKTSINIPNAQAMFILSALSHAHICSSGTYYQRKAAYYTDYSASYGGDWKIVRRAEYSHVGESGLGEDNADYQTSLKDVATVKSDGTGLVPYTVANYTTSFEVVNGNNTYQGYGIFNAARDTTSVDFNIGYSSNGEVSTEETEQVDTSKIWYLPDGFRGIGGFHFGNNNPANRMFYLRNFNGNGYVISLDMQYAQYGKDTDKSWFDADAYYPGYNSQETGFGLFNNITENAKGRVTDDEQNTNTINRITLKGNISTYIYKPDGTLVESSYQDTQNRVTDSRYLTAAGFAGRDFYNVNAQFNFENVLLTDLYVKSSKYAAGLLSLVNPNNDNGKITIKHCSTSNLEIEGGLYAAGCIGRFMRGQLEVDDLDLKFKSIKNDKFSSDTWNTNGIDKNGVAGIVASVYSQQIPMTFKNVTLGDKTKTSYIGYTDGTKYNNKDYETVFAGGLVGDTRSKSPIVMENCTAYNLNVYGHRAGVFAGHIYPQAQTTSTIYNCHAINTLGDQVKVYGVLNYGASTEDGGAAAMVGFIDRAQINLIDCSVEGYNVYGTRDVGGAFGQLRLRDKNSTINMHVVNFKLENVHIYADYKAGGLVGYMKVSNTSGTSGNLTGYNIVTNNVYIDKNKQTSVTDGGNVIGKRDNPFVIKLAGISQQGAVPTDKIVGTGAKISNVESKYGNGGYIVYADYTGAALKNSTQGKTFSVFNNTNNVGAFNPDTRTFTDPVTDNWPYATTSKITNLTSGDVSQFLSGDGVNTSAITSILSGLSGTSNKRYTVAGEAIGTYNTSKITQQISTAYKEYGNYGGLDFPVLVLDSTAATETSELVNNYLKLLTNTDYNFAAGDYNGTDETNAFRVVRTTYKYENGSFVEQSTEPTLQYNSTLGFYMTARSVDSNSIEPQFTLLDVQFFDPNDPSTTDRKVAYHLYLPVYTSKVTQFRYNAYLASGTDYYAVPYTTRSLFENFGTPVTLKVDYSYSTRTKAEWIAAINGGESVMGNYYKTISIGNETENWKAGTKFALVDVTNNGKVYYLDNFAGGNTDLSLEFEDFADENSNAYKPVPLYKVLQVVVGQNDSGTLVKLEEGEGTTVATVSYNGELFRPAGTGDETKTKYSVTDVAVNAVESYYLSIFTPKASTNENVYHYKFKTIDKLVAKTDETMPSCKISGTNYVCDLYSGDLYSNNISNLTVISNGTNDPKLTESNNSLTVSMTAMVGLTDTAINKGIKENLASNTTAAIFQTFLMTYDMLDANQETKIGIQPGSEPTVGIISYTINRSDVNSASTINKTLNHIEFANNTNLREALISSSGQAEIAIAARLQYDSATLGIQFPKKTDGSNLTVGSSVIGYSKLASSSAGAAFSSTFDMERDLMRYYCDDTVSAKLNYHLDMANSNTNNEPAGPYTDLGINSYEMTDDTYAIYTEARYDTSMLKGAGEYVELTLKVSNKSSYTSWLPIDSYINDIKILDKNGNDFLSDSYSGDAQITHSGATDDAYVLRVRKSLLETDGENIYIFPIELTVHTGDGKFKGKNNADGDPMLYANYMVHLDAGIYSQLTGGDVFEPSKAEDHLIYTNARMDVSFQE